MKKNNLIEMLQGCSMRNGMPVSASNPDGGQTCDGNRQSRLMSYRCYLRNLAVIFAILTLSIANIGMAWGANTPAAAGTYTLTASNKPGNTNKFYKLGNGVYIHRRNNSSQGDDGLKVTKENTNGIAVYVNSSMNLSCSIYKASSKEEQTVGINVYTLSNGSTTFDSFESGTDNSTTVSVTLSASATYTTSVSFAAAESKTAETKSSSNITLEAGYYYIVPAETTNKGKTYLKSITLAAAAAPSCTARTFKSGEKIYFKDQESNFDFDALWKVESGQLYAYFWNDGESEKAWSDAAGTCVEGSWNAANAIYELTVPGLGKEYTHVLFTRGNAQNFDSGTWDKTTNQEPCEGKNLFYVEKGKYADHIYYGHWGNYTPGGKTVYFDARIAPDTWTTAYVRIGHGSSNSAWGAMTKVAGTKCLYSQTTSKWASHTDFAIADKAGWAGSNAIDQPEKTYTNGSWSSSEYKMTKQTNYQQYAIENDIYICPKATSVLEHECQYYQVTNANSTTSSRIDENTTAMALPEYTVTATGSHCTVTMEKYNNDAGSSTTALASGGTVLPTQYVKVTVTPDANYQFSSVEVTGAGIVTAAAAGTPGVYYITGDATITATCTCVALAVNIGGTPATPAEGEPLGTACGTLTCSATTGVIASYQWMQNTSAITEGAVNAEGTGATTASFSPNPAAAGTYYYYCVATDACGNSANTSFSGAFKFNAAAYTVTYNKNGDGAGGEGSVTGTVPTDATSYTSGQRPVVKGPGDLAWDGHTFIGWNDKADGSGTYYSEKANFAISASKTLYAQWRTASSCPGDEGGTVFSLSMNNRTESGLQLAKGVSVNLSSHAAITNGGASLTNISTSDDNKATITKASPALVQFGGAAAMLAIYLDCALQKDDEITITTSASQEVCFTATPSRSEALATSSKTYTIPSGSPLIGKKIIYIWRKGTTTFGISALSITRPASVSNYTGLSVTKDPSEGSASDPTISATSVAQGSGVTVTAGAAAPGYVFTGWTSENGTFGDASALSTTFTPNADNAVATAHYSATKTIVIKFQHNGNTTGWTIQGKTTYPADQTATIDVDGDWVVMTFSNVYAVSNIDLAYSGGDWDYLNTSTKITDDACYSWTGVAINCVVQTALVANTLYEVPDMIPSAASLTSEDQFFDGLSANTKFELIGSASGSTTPKVNNNTSNDRTIDDIPFDDGSMWFKGNASLTSNIPTTFGLSFIVPEGGGKLYLYFNNTGTSTNIKLAKSGSTGSNPTLTDGFAAIDVTAGTYYLYGTGTTSPYSFYGLKLCSTYGVTITPTNVTKETGAIGAGAAIHGKAYTATFTANTGYTLPSDVTVTIGGTPATKGTEYTWSVSDDTGTLTVKAEQVTGDIVVTVTGTAAATYALTYNCNGAESGCPSNTTASALPNPLPTGLTKDGYTFGGWYTDEELTVPAVAGAAMTEATTLYAKWTADECTPTTLFSMVVNPSAEDYKLSASTEMTSELTSRLTSYSGGTPSIYNTTTSSSKDVIKNNTVYLGSNDVYLKVVLSGGNTLQAGDVITITTRTAYQPYITKTTTRTTTPTMTKTGSSDPYTHSITLANTNSDSGQDIIGGGTLYFWKNSNTVEIRSITITRPCDESAETCKTPNITNIASTTEMTTAETKSLNVTLGNADALTGTVSYAWTNADGSAIDAAAKATGTTTARLTLTEPAAGTYTFKCTVTNDCGGEGSQSSTSAIFTVNVTESAGCTEIAKVIVSGASTGTKSGTKIAETDGYGVNLENTQTTHGGNTGYKIGSSKYVYLQLASGEQFQNGDKVKVYITNLSDQGDHKLHIFQGTTAVGTEVATVETPVLGWNEATLSNVTTGNRSLTIHRSSGTTEQNHGIYAFAVERCKDCSSATHEGLAYSATSYTIGDAASALTVTNPENVDTYQWKWNTTGDRTSGSNCGTNSASFTPPTTAEAEGTRYYWCELTNDCGTVKTSAVGITVSAVLTEVTVTWTDPAEVNYGGGGYTIKATVDPAAWDGTLDASMLTAPDGIRIYDVTTGTDGESKKYIQATFDVQTTFDREANATVIPFALTLAATATYESKISEHNVTYDACAAGGGGSNVYVIGYSNSNATNISGSADFRAYETASDWYSKGNTTFTDKTSTDGFTISATEKSSYYWQNNGTFTESSTNNCRLKTIKLAKGSGVTIRWTNDELSFSKVRFIGRNTAAGDPTTFTVSNGTTEKTFTFEAGNSEIQTKEVTMDFVSGNTKGIVISGGTKEVNILIELIPAGTATITTALTWSNSQASGVTLTKDEGTADFAITAVRDAVATTSLGAVTYSSSDASVATVNETTGQVHIADNIDFGGATYKETTITATLAASGCFKRAEITYVLQINERACEDVAGTASAASEGCNTTLTLSGYTAGATIQWYKDGVSLGSADGAQTATYVATSAGDYYAVTHKTCDRTSNTVTVTSTAVSATKIVDEWYVKNGRRTPDIALVKTKNATGFIVTTGSPASDITSTGIGGCGFYLGTDGIIYLRGAKNDGSAPSGMTEGDTEISITASGCTDAAPVTITIHRQVETDKYVLAYVVTGTQDGGWTENTPYNQTTGVELYRTLTNHFDLQATNIYATTDEQKIKEYYSRYDIIFITDYPNTKKTNTTTKKSYVDALGAMIDIRPILTMEAWMSGLTNWSEKGVKGSPKSPTTRQYNMLLQCKDHEIFSGTTVETIGEGDDVKFKINMVDSTKLLYDTLDTKYGAGTHEEKKGYCYGTHPALQGFVYDEALADMLPLGLIDDGAGNDLQVGLERQKEMEARMMVLGINADAMERLSDDGETVIVNALKYLMKKDAEDISDCSIYFDNAGGDNLWSNVANWGPSRLTLPQPTQEARIFQPCIVQGEANAASITIISGGKYNHGTTDANGSLTIAKSGILKVGGRIVAASAPNYYEVRPTDASKLIIEADHLQTGALIHGHKSGELNATVQLVSSSYSVIEQVDGKNKKKKYWQYIGLPVQSALAEDAFYGAYTYKYNEPSGWEKKGTGTTLEEFWGIGLSVDNIALGISSPVTFNISGALALATDRDIELTKTAEAGKGQNMIGNSWTAPIHLVNMTADDFENATATIYIYNTGRDEQAPGGDVGTSTFANGSTQPGQWISIPVAASKLDPWLGPKVIPAMQAFEVDVADGSTSGMLHLNYDKHVRNIGTAPEENAALKAPKRYQADEPSMMRLRVADTATYTDLYLIEGEEFSDEFDNGYDGKYQQCDGRSAALYALSPIGNMAVLAQQSINNTAIVFRPGRQNEYTFTFGYNGEVAYYLNDLLLEQSTEIREGNEYRFTCNEGDMESRFVVSTTPFGAPDITTGIGNAGHPEKVQKIMYKDHIYIIRAGRVYDIVGKEVR